MVRSTKTPEERIAELSQKKAQIDARIQRESAKIRDVERKKDTRRKIIAGALALEHADKDPDFSTTLNRLLSRYVDRSEDRALFKLDPKQKTDVDALQNSEISET